VNLSHYAGDCKKRGVPVPDEAAMVQAGREAILRRFKEAGHGGAPYKSNAVNPVAP
jgi:phytoene desaturase (3,4-didehydrolycopene-forming)